LSLLQAGFLGGARGAVNTRVQPKLPLTFEANLGQAPPDVRYLARGRGFTLLIGDRESAVHLYGSRGMLRMRLAGARPNPQLQALDPSPEVANYYLGSDPSKWLRGVPTFSRIKLKGVYAGIDLVYYGTDEAFEYDLLLSPRADPRQVRIAFDGATKLRVSRSGDLIAETPSAELVQRAPAAWQDSNGWRRPVRAQWYLVDEHTAGFAIASYDVAQPLVIDPILDFTLFVGGSDDDIATGVGSTGSVVFLGGYTRSLDFPGRVFTAGRSGFDSFVTKIDSTTGQILSTTYLGGSGDDRITSMRTYPGAGVIVAGETSSQDFPVMAGSNAPLQSTYGGGSSDAFVALLDQRGALTYSSYFGGSGDDRATAVSQDSSTSFILAGETTSTDLRLVNPFQATHGGGIDAFVVSASNGFVRFSTYLGGSGDDRAASVESCGGYICIAGETSSDNFPLMRPSQERLSGASDAFISEINPATSQLVWSTYLGGSGRDAAVSVRRLDNGDLVVAGDTASPDFPITNASQPQFAGGATDIFLARFKIDNTLSFSTYFGGSGDDHASMIASSDLPGSLSAEFVFITGYTTSQDLPLKDPSQPFFGGGPDDAFVLQIGPAGEVIQSTYFGGSGSDRGLAIVADQMGGLWLAGRSDSSDLPLASSGGNSPRGSTDAFLAHLYPAAIIAPSAVVGKDLQTSVVISFPSSVQGVAGITITSSDPSKLLVSAGPNDPGAATTILSTIANSRSATLYLQALDSGSEVSYTVSAPGLGSQAAKVLLTDAYINVVASVPGSFILVPDFTTTLRAGDIALEVDLFGFDPAINRVSPALGLRPGVSGVEIGFVSSDPSVGSILDPKIDLASVRRTQFRPAGLGTTEITCSVPPGFRTFRNPVVRATIASPAILARDTLVGKDLQTELSISFNHPAPYGPADLRIASEDPSRLLVTTDQTRPGQAVATIHVEGGTTPRLWVQGLAASGAVRVSVSADGYDNGVATVSLAPSGFELSTPAGLFADFSTTTLNTSDRLFVFSEALDPGTLGLRLGQNLRPGVNAVSLTFTISDPKVAQLNSPVTFNPGASSVSVPVQGLIAGTAALALTVPQGYSTPAESRQVSMSVRAPALDMKGITVGKDLQSGLSVRLNGPAPQGGLAVTFTSSDPSRLLLSAAADRVGAAQVSSTISAGSTSASVLAQALASAGTVRVTAAVSGLAPVSADVVLVESTVVMDILPFRTSIFADPVSIPVYAASVDPVSGAPLAPQQRRAGTNSVLVQIASSFPDIGAVPDPVEIKPSVLQATATFRATGRGQTELTLAQPDGFVPSLQRRVLASISGANMSVPDLVVGLGLQSQARVNLPRNLPADQRFTITSSDPDHLLLSGTGTEPGSASIGVAPASGSFVFYAQSLSDHGTVKIVAASPGFEDSSANVTLAPSGFVFEPLTSPQAETAITFDALAAPVTVNVRAAPLSPGSLIPLLSDVQSLRPGIEAVSVAVTSSDVGIADLSDSSLPFNPGVSRRSVQVRPHAAGAASIRLGTPAGFSTPAARNELSVTVRMPTFTAPRALAIGKDLEVPVQISLSGAGPQTMAPVTFISSDPSKLLLSLSDQQLGSASFTLVSRSGGASLPYFYAQALSDEGTVEIKISAPGFIDASVPVRLTPVSLIFDDAASYSQGYPASLFTGNTKLRVVQYAADSNSGLIGVESRRPGADLSITVASSNLAVALVANSPLILRAGDSEATVEVHPLTIGSTLLSIGQPEGFVAAPRGLDHLAYNVRGLRLTAAGVTAVGKDLQSYISLGSATFLNQPVQITLTSSDPSKLLLSSRSDMPGLASGTVTLQAGSLPFYLQALTDRSTVTVTAKGEGFETLEIPITLVPSGFAVGLIHADNLNGIAGGPPLDFSIGAAALDPNTLAATGYQQLRPGYPGVSVSLASSNPQVGVAGDNNTSFVQFTGGGEPRRTLFQPLSPGTTVISVTPPAGFATPAAAYRQITFTVKPPGIGLQTNTFGRLGKDLQTYLYVLPSSGISIAGLTATATSSDATLLLVSMTPTAVGSASLSFKLAPGGFPSVVVQALADNGTASVTVTLPGFSDGSTQFQLVPSGYAFITPPTVISIGQSDREAVRLGAIDAATGQVLTDGALRAGINPVSVEVVNSDPSIGDIGPPVEFRPSDPGFVTTSSVSFQAKSAGTATLTIKPPPGFAQAENGHIDVTVR
jgi:hypothetical protein